MASKIRYTVFAAIGIAAASATAWWLQQSSQRPVEVASTDAPAASGRGGHRAGAAGRRSEASGSSRPMAVEAASVQELVLRDDAQAVGSLRSRRSVVLRPEVSGRITQLNFRDGERVRQGQVLVQLDDQLPRAQIQQSQAELSIAKANHKRNQELVAQGFISQRSVDESAANLEVAQAKLALVQATASRLRIVAPFDGIAGIRGVNVGDYLKDGADIVNIEDTDAVFVDFRLPERLQSKVRTGQTASVAFDALPGVQYAAVVQAISPQVDADGRSIAVRACIDNRRLQLRPGMFARVTAVFAERAKARMVPEEAVVSAGSTAYVIKIVEGKDPGSRVTQRAPIVLGARVPGMVEVVEGLHPGDLVITAGQQRISNDGTAVRVVELGKPAAAHGVSAPPAGGASEAAVGPANPDKVLPATASAMPASSPPASTWAVPLPGTDPCRTASALRSGIPSNARQPG